ncbi:hypothetical protein LVD15_00130 [Fulvivirga maritima]|uniref:hypothetical protein n=1 Tax=Fulvivirga maritima TaxID=2904247 RepID=UPI001F1FAA1D|nr:hypothetical protein [Fulvivirga maritima]UII26879.1 hypothetical protein LVD15_00130 [Fulvivirga maritima]
MQISFSRSSHSVKINSNHHRQKEEVELADNFVWLDDFLFIFQIKGRNEKATGSVEKWYKKKVRNVAVGQIKNSLEYLNSFKQIKVQNEKGHEFDVSEARNISPTKSYHLLS